MTNLAQSWYDLTLLSPQDPRSILSYATIADSTGAAIVGLFQNSNDFKKTGAAWSTTVPLVYSGTPAVYSNDPTSALTIQDANEWNFNHQMRTTDTLIPDALQRMVFGRLGPLFGNAFYLTFSATIIDIEISFLENFTSGGNFTGGGLGTVPVISFTSANNFSGASRQMQLVFKRAGTYRMAFRLIDNAGNWSVFQTDWIVND